MKSKWSIEFVNKDAENEVSGLEASFKAKLIHISELLEKFGPFEVGEPHVKSLGDKLWEIRMRGKSGIARAIYMIHIERRIIILHTFIKKTQKTPKQALEKAKNRIKEIK